MKRSIAVITSLLGAVSLFFGCGPDKEVEVSAVSISQPAAEMIVGETITLKATVLPENAGSKDIIWASSKLSVASVTQDGVVTALSEGTSNITASAGGKVGSCTVVVSKGYVAVSSIELNKKVLPLEEDEEFTLVATVKPDDATDKNVEWESSDKSVVTVDKNGKVKGIKEGEAKIIARAGGKEAECAIAVTAKKIPVTMIMLDKQALTIEIGASDKLIATIVPDNATDKSIRWSSSNPGIATVNDGIVSGISEGEAQIVAYADGQTAICQVTVMPIPVSSVELNENELVMMIGESFTLEATVYPEDATHKEIKWESSDDSIVSVDNDGIITALNTGTATITACAGDCKVSCSIIVRSAGSNEGTGEENWN